MTFLLAIAFRLVAFCRHSQGEDDCGKEKVVEVHGN